MKFTKLTLLLLLLVYPAFSGAPDNSGHWLKVKWANDVFFQTDQYFTNGFNLEYYSRTNSHSFINILHLPDQRYAKTYYGWGIQQDIFTPEDFKFNSNQFSDRPFASYFVLASRKIQTDDVNKLITSSEIEVGLFGKYSGGEWIQNSIHSLLPTSSFVAGWENQVKSDLIINYGIELEKGLLNHQHASLSGYVGGKLGSQHTYANAGFRVRSGDIQDYFKNENFSSKTSWQGYFFTGLGGKYVLYNATIQGGLFSDNPHLHSPAISSYVYEFESGFNMSFKRINLEIGAKYLSPEFKNGTNHVWGYISFMICL